MNGIREFPALGDFWLRGHPQQLFLYIKHIFRQLVQSEFLNLITSSINCDDALVFNLLLEGSMQDLELEVYL